MTRQHIGLMFGFKEMTKRIRNQFNPPLVDVLYFEGSLFQVWIAAQQTIHFQRSFPSFCHRLRCVRAESTRTLWWHPDSKGWRSRGYEALALIMSLQCPRAPATIQQNRSSMLSFSCSHYNHGAFRLKSLLQNFHHVVWRYWNNLLIYIGV